MCKNDIFYTVLGGMVSAEVGEEQRTELQAYNEDAQSVEHSDAEIVSVAFLGVKPCLDHLDYVCFHNFVLSSVNFHDAKLWRRTANCRQENVKIS